MPRAQQGLQLEAVMCNFSSRKAWRVVRAAFAAAGITTMPDKFTGAEQVSVSFSRAQENSSAVQYASLAIP